jgi:RNA polymerase sigma factor (TIGR02999 family)
MSQQPQETPGSDYDRQALDSCFTRLYDNIRHLARRLGWTSTNPTLNATALAHEAYLRLRKDPPDLASKSHEETIAIFANSMRQILIDAARRKSARKRQQEALPESNRLPIEDALTVAMALEDLARAAPQQGRIAEARFLLGMTASETANALGVSVRTVEREWQEARTCLAGKLQVAKEQLP